MAELAADGGDFSRAGHVDARARPVVNLVNRQPNFFTTSSCAGRVSLFSDPTSATRAKGLKGGEWVYVNHDPANADDVVAAVRRKLGEGGGGGKGGGKCAGEGGIGGGGVDDGGGGAPAGRGDADPDPDLDPECTLVLRFEPFILSVEAVSVEEGSRMVAAARDAGYRESGITACDKRTIIAVRCSIRMEVPVVHKGTRLVTEEALRRLVAIANEKHAANAARAERLVERFTAVFGPGLGHSPSPPSPPSSGLLPPWATSPASPVSSEMLLAWATSPASPLSPGKQSAWAAAGLPSGATTSTAHSPRYSRVDAAQRHMLGWLDAIDTAVSSGESSAGSPAAAASARASRQAAVAAAAGASRQAAAGAAATETARALRFAAAGATTAEAGGEDGGGDWIFFVDKGAAKRCKDAIKACKWLDQSRRAGASRDGARIALPITSTGAAMLLRAFSTASIPAPTASTPAPSPAPAPAATIPAAAQPALTSLGEGAAELVRSTAEGGKGSGGSVGGGGGGDGVPQLQAKTSYRSPAAVIKAAALSLLPPANAAASTSASSAAASASAISNEIPSKWEKLGDLALLPAGSFASEEVWTPAVCRQLYPQVAAALGVTRLARQAEVGQGPKRESRAAMLWDPDGRGGWVETRELGVTYGLDVTKVMFSSGNGTEKARMAKLSAAGETVVDLFAGIGYYTLQLLRHAGVAKVYACEWNPNAAAALRANLASNGVAPHRCEVLEGDNRRTAPVGVADRVVLGLLPDSECSWAAAVAALRPARGGAMHVHGNVASGDEEAWAKRVEGAMSALARASGREWDVRVEHVERVKWYAPRVRHVVADVRCVPKAKANTNAVEAQNARGGGPASGSADAARPATVRVPAAAAAAAPGGPVRRMHRPTPSAFRSGPASTREPCVLTGLDVGPAPWLWSPQHLASMPAVASADVSVHVSDTPDLDFVRKNFTFTNMPFGELLAALAAETEGGDDDDDEEKNKKNKAKTFYYLRSIGRNPRKEPAHALDQFPDLAEELKLPADVLYPRGEGGAGGGDDDRYFSAVLRCSSGGLRLWTHYDAMDNALMQLHGEKRVLLYPPRAGAGLYLEGSSSPVVGPAVDGEGGGWPAEFPAYEQARRAALEVVLQPGDVLYIPALWAHRVEALHGPSVAVNVFFRELPEASYPRKDLYGNADPVAAGRALEACAGAARDLTSLPRDHRVFYGGVAAARLLRDLRIEEEVGAMVALAAAAAAGGSAGLERASWNVFPAFASASSLSVVTAHVNDWADAAKGAAVGAAFAGLVSAALVAWSRPR